MRSKSEGFEFLKKGWPILTSVALSWAGIASTSLTIAMGTFLFCTSSGATLEDSSLVALREVLVDTTTEEAEEGAEEE